MKLSTIILSMIAETDTFILISKISSYFSMGLLFLYLVFHVYFGIQLMKTKMKALTFYWIYTLAPLFSLISNRYAIAYKNMLLYIIGALMNVSIILSLYIFFKIQDKTIFPFNEETVLTS